MALRSLDIPESQILVYDEGDQVPWHARILLVRAGGSRWIWASPTLDMQCEDLAEVEDLRPLGTGRAQSHGLRATLRVRGGLGGGAAADAVGRRPLRRRLGGGDGLRCGRQRTPLGSSPIRRTTASARRSPPNPWQEVEPSSGARGRSCSNPRTATLGRPRSGYVPTTATTGSRRRGPAQDETLDSIWGLAARAADHFWRRP